jgi:hypothetical protein
MKRRTWIKLGLISGAVLAVAAGSIALIQPARREGRLTERGRAVFAALAPAVLDTLLPTEPEARAHAVQAYLGRVEVALAGLPPALQAEVDELITVLGSTAGRLALTGLRNDWSVATPSELAAALQGMRESSLAVRQQAFHAVRDITSSSYFSDTGTWATIGYPGQRPV